MSVCLKDKVIFTCKQSFHVAKYFFKKDADQDAEAKYAGNVQNDNFLHMFIVIGFCVSQTSTFVKPLNSKKWVDQLETEHTVVYENSLVKFDMSYYLIKVKVIEGLRFFSIHHITN